MSPVLQVLSTTWGLLGWWWIPVGFVALSVFSIGGILANRNDRQLRETWKRNR